MTIANVVDSLNHIFFIHPLFPCVDCHPCPSISQWNCPTQFCVAVTQCSFINYIVSFSFIHYPYFVWTATPFCLFPKWSCPTLLCLSITQISCVSSPLPLCECHTCASPFPLCECDTNILVSPLILSGYFALSRFKSSLSHSYSNLVWTTTPLFLNEKFTCVGQVFSVLII